MSHQAYKNESRSARPGQRVETKSNIFIKSLLKGALKGLAIWGELLILSCDKMGDGLFQSMPLA